MSDYPYPTSYRCSDRYAMILEIQYLRERLESVCYDRDCIRDAVEAYLSCDVDSSTDWDATFEAMARALSNSTGRDPVPGLKAAMASVDLDWKDDVEE